MIPSRRIFEDHAVDYDRWFDEHRDAYEAEVRVLRDAVPGTGRGLDVGVGSGRFAVPLGICCGIDPSPGLGMMAKQRGIEMVVGEGEHLPYRAGSFDHVLIMTVICFLEDPVLVFREVYRVIRPGGILVAGFIEGGGEISLQDPGEAGRGQFLRYTKFRTAGEVRGFFRNAEFVNISTVTKARGICVMSGRRV
ncbi:class I SAM-dependent methyltransferase [Methanoregula sp.]|uniref:class I SAM-dependent methyltransferase n=1 Tax=Methanoregula sp. TaxID=2052170 RepID=UPI003C1DE393